jgi:hypothetical protein
VEPAESNVLNGGKPGKICANLLLLSLSLSLSLFLSVKNKVGKFVLVREVALCNNVH